MFDESAIAYKLGSHQRDKTKSPTNEKANKRKSKQMIFARGADEYK